MNNKTYHIFFSKLSSPLKIEIISLLKKNEKGLSVTEITKTMWVEQSKLSHALADLRSCNLVTVKQKGKQRIYSLNKETMLPILEIIDKHAQSYCGGNCAYCAKCEEK